MRNCGSQSSKVRNRNSATFLVRNSAIDLVVRNIAELRRCGINLRTPTFAVYSIKRAYLCLYLLNEKILFFSEAFGLEKIGITRIITY
jgi:hypothetical protein